MEKVKPSITLDWEKAKQSGIIDADFFLADIFSKENTTLRDRLYVLLKKNHYELDRKIDSAGLFDSKKAQFNDNQIAHNQFGISTSALHVKNTGNILLIVETYLFRKTSESAKVHSSHLNAG